jgi:hypothetical protein
MMMIDCSSSSDSSQPSASTAGPSQQPIMFGGMFSFVLCQIKTMRLLGKRYYIRFDSLS